MSAEPNENVAQNEQDEEEEEIETNFVNKILEDMLLSYSMVDLSNYSFEKLSEFDTDEQNGIYGIREDIQAVFNSARARYYNNIKENIKTVSERFNIKEITATISECKSFIECFKEFNISLDEFINYMNLSSFDEPQVFIAEKCLLGPIEEATKKYEESIKSRKEELAQLEKEIQVNFNSYFSNE